MAYKFKLAAIVAALLAISAGAAGASLHGRSAISEGAGGNSSIGLKLEVAAFYYQVQSVGASIASSGVNTTTEGSAQYTVFKGELDTLENLWRNGSAESLAKLPNQLQVVQAASLRYATQVQGDVQSLSGLKKISALLLVAKLRALAASAAAVSVSAAAELL